MEAAWLAELDSSATVINSGVRGHPIPAHSAIPPTSPLTSGIQGGWDGKRAGDGAELSRMRRTTLCPPYANPEVPPDSTLTAQAKREARAARYTEAKRERSNSKVPSARILESRDTVLVWLLHL